ncbi:MAG: hypothetical protein LBL13_08465 [Bacteroidales bacterium]|nr:hypothetical protein [Bacteroidales bacterium]
MEVNQSEPSEKLGMQQQLRRISIMQLLLWYHIPGALIVINRDGRKCPI